MRDDEGTFFFFFFSVVGASTTACGTEASGASSSAAASVGVEEPSTATFAGCPRNSRLLSAAVSMSFTRRLQQSELLIYFSLPLVFLVDLYEGLGRYFLPLSAFVGVSPPLTALHS